MVIEKLHEAGAGADDAAQAMFNRQFATIEKITRENLMYHREVYGILREVSVGDGADGDAASEILRRRSLDLERAACDVHAFSHGPGEMRADDGR